MESVAESHSPLQQRNSTSSGSSRGSNKRKSFEGQENNENSPVNVPNKAQNVEKPTPQSASKMFKDVLISGSSALATGYQHLSSVMKNADEARTTASSSNKKKSSLPVPRRKLSASTGPTKTTTLKQAPTGTKMPAEPSSALKKKQVTEQSTAERCTNATPMKVPGSSRKAPLTKEKSNDILPEDKMLAPNASINAIMKRLKKIISATPSPDVIRSHFETGFSINDERLATIITHLKVKSKWDYKEKAKKQEAVIKELRECLNITFAEIKSTKEKCILQENSTNGMLRDCYEEFLDSVQIINTFQATNNKLQQDLLRVNDDMRSTSSALMKYKTETSPLRNRTKDSESRISELQAQLMLEQTKGTQAANDLAKLEKDFAELKMKSEAALATQKEDFDQRLEVSVQGYREEVALLREDLSRRQSDADRYSGEKADLDHKKQEMQEEVVRLQSRLRESENTSARYEKDIDRYSGEVDKLRETLTQKDSDLRATINSLQEIQRQANHEKNGIRAELSLCQARVQLLEEERLEINTQLATKKEECVSQGKEVAQLKEQIGQLETKLTQQDEEMKGSKESVMQLEVEKELRMRCEVREDAERRERIAAVSQLLAIESDCKNRIREIEEKNSTELEAVESQLRAIAQQKDEVAEDLKRQNDVAAGLEKEVQQLHTELENASVNHESVEKLGKVTGELEVMRRRVQELTEAQALQGSTDARRIAEYEEKLRAGEVQRRKLHNLVQELRGNVRVFARVRPFLPNDGLDMAALPEPTIAVRSDMNSLRIHRDSRSPDERPEDHSFNFDKAFGPSTSQETLFKEVSEFVQSALDGYNVCLFSYGQTGSGKTHTMQGSGNGSMRGVIPRAMEQVGIYKTELEAKGWQYEMQVSFVEIYNETIRDLLRSETNDVTHDIKKDAQGGVYVTDVTMVHVDPNDVEQVENIMEEAARHRSVGQTAMNERSSRSHSVFALHLKATNVEQGIVLKGTLSLVDLAGSERLDRSGATGSQLKETVAINKSLSALTDVFVAIGNKQAHIPFRNSKLTYLLQPALSGDGKTLMMVNLSPTEESFHESLCSLRLAKQINQCELGKPKKQVKEATAGSSSTSTSAKISSSSSSATPLTKNTSSRATKQMSASMSNVSTTSSNADGSGASVTPQMLTASLGGRRPNTSGPANSSSTTATAIATKKARK